MSTIVQYNNTIQEGYLEIILGPMFSGKTTQLIKEYDTYSYIGKNVIVINYADDKRYHSSMLSTHDRKMIPCILSYDVHDMWFNKSNENYFKLNNADVILLNEAQFFINLKDVIISMLEKNKIIFICGLDGDFKRNKFGDIIDLIPYCDKVTKLTSLCSQCKNGKKGIFSYRITNETNQIMVGSDNYKTLCRLCYYNHQNM